MTYYLTRFLNEGSQHLVAAPLCGGGGEGMATCDKKASSSSSSPNATCDRRGSHLESHSRNAVYGVKISWLSQTVKGYLKDCFRHRAVAVPLFALYRVMEQLLDLHFVGISQINQQKLVHEVHAVTPVRSVPVPVCGLRI